MRPPDASLCIVVNDLEKPRPAAPVCALPMSSFGTVKVAGPAVPPDFDVASLLKPASVKLGSPAKKARKPRARK